MKNIHAVLGTDEGQVKEQALSIYRELTGGEESEFAHEIIDGMADNSDSAHGICVQVIQALNTLPFFGGSKVVWLKSANFLSDSVTGRSERTQSGISQLQDCLAAGLPEEVQFLLSATGIDKRRGFWKFLAENGEVRVFDKVDTSRDGWEHQVAALVRKHADEFELQFEPNALELFIAQAGEATQQIRNELEKLSLFLGEKRRPITFDDVRTMVPMTRAGIVFEIGAALKSGRADRAIELIDRFLESEENDKSAIAIMRASLIPTVRNLFMAKLVSELGIRSSNYGSFVGALEKLPPHQKSWLPQKKSGGISAYPIFLALNVAKRFSLPALQNLMKSVLKADRLLVTSGLDHRFILHRFIVEMTSTMGK